MKSPPPPSYFGVGGGLGGGGQGGGGHIYSCTTPRRSIVYGHGLLQVDAVCQLLTPSACWRRKVTIFGKGAEGPPPKSGLLSAFTRAPLREVRWGGVEGGGMGGNGGRSKGGNDRGA